MSDTEKEIHYPQNRIIYKKLREGATTGFDILEELSVEATSIDEAWKIFMMLKAEMTK